MPTPQTIAILYAPSEEPVAQMCNMHLSVLRRSRIATISLVSTEAPDLALETSIVLVILSATMLAWWCFAPIVGAIESRHEGDRCRVVPVLFKSCNLTGSWFQRLQKLPKDWDTAGSIDERTHPDQAWTTVVDDVRTIVERPAGKAARP
jgi:hypothetical protein